MGETTRCPRCGSEHFGSVLVHGSPIFHCHDEFGRGCHYYGPFPNETTNQGPASVAEQPAAVDNGWIEGQPRREGCYEVEYHNTIVFGCNVIVPVRHRPVPPAHATVEATSLPNPSVVMLRESLPTYFIVKGRKRTRVFSVHENDEGNAELIRTEVPLDHMDVRLCESPPAPAPASSDTGDQPEPPWLEPVPASDELAVQPATDAKIDDSFIEHEIRTLPSGKEFTRHRCKACKAYWDEGEKEFHRPDCVLVSFIAAHADELATLRRAVSQATTALDAVVRRRDELQAENERLRGELEYAYQENGRLRKDMKDIDELESDLTACRAKLVAIQQEKDNLGVRLELAERKLAEAEREKAPPASDKPKLPESLRSMHSVLKVLNQFNTTDSWFSVLEDTFDCSPAKEAT